MAPEQATESSLDQRCDHYAVGVILYQMATGHLPFDGQNSMEVLTKHVNEPPVPPRKRQPDAPISEAMESLILRALEKDPALRPQNAEEFRNLILDIPRRKAGVPASFRDPLITPSEGVTIPSQSPSGATAAAPDKSKPPAAPTPASSARRNIALGAAGAAALIAAAGYGLRARQPAVAPAVTTVAAATPAPVPPVSPSAVARDPAKARDLVLRASEWQAANDTGAARDLLDQAVQLDPDNAEAHYRLGGLFLNSQPDRARHEYEAAKRLNAPKYADVVDTILKGL